MRVSAKFFHTTMVTLLLGVSLLPFSTAVTAATDLGVEFSGGVMTVSSTDADRLYVRIAGPGGFFEELHGKGSVHWTPGPGLSDGLYRYDSYANDNAASEGRTESVKTSGAFELVDGQLRTVVIPGQESIGSMGPASGLLAFADAILEFIVPSANAANLTTSSTFPALFFEDTDGPTTIFGMGANSTATNTDFLLTNSAEVFNVLYVRNANGTSDTQNSIMIGLGGPGDIAFANNSVYIDKSAGRLGIGTTTPLSVLDLVEATSTSATIGMQSTAGATSRYDLSVNSSGFSMGESGNSSFLLANGASKFSMVIGSTLGSSNNIGLGTDAPETGLHMFSNDGEGIIKVQETNGVTQKRIQVQLENNGPTGFKFVDTSVADRAWTVSMLNGGGFTFSFVGTGGGEFQITPGGRVTMGPGPVTNFDLTQSGDLDIPNGEVSAVAFNTLSSRNAKRNFRPLDGGEIVRKLSDLPIAEWEYRNPNVAGRHVGPVAEEFHAAFGLGPSDKTVSPTDMAGIGLVAAKHLAQEAEQLRGELQSTDAEVERLRSENADLQTRLAALEALVRDMQSGR